MTKRFAPFVALVLFALTGCGSGLSAHNGFVSALSSNEEAVQAVTVTPASLRFVQVGATQTFQASTQFAGDISAVSSNSSCATVDPPSQPVGTPPAGPDGVKSATFTVTATGSGRCTITVTDKKGNTATVLVLFLTD